MKTAIFRGGPQDGTVRQIQHGLSTFRFEEMLPLSYLDYQDVQPIALNIKHIVYCFVGETVFGELLYQFEPTK